VNTFASNSEWQDSGHVPKGVVGWLLFLCVSMTIIAPTFQARIAWKAFWNLAQAHLITLPLVLRLTSVGALYTSLALSSVWAGFWLWREDPRGVSLAKVYLLVSPMLVISLDAVLVLTGTKIELVEVIAGRIPYSIVWYLYLSSSKRVRTTYFEYEKSPPAIKPATR